MYEEHQARVERSQRYIEAIRKKEFPIDAERLVKNFFKTSNKDAEGAYKMLTNNPATFAPIEINKIKPRLFGLIKERIVKRMEILDSLLLGSGIPIIGCSAHIISVYESLISSIKKI